MIFLYFSEWLLALKKLNNSLNGMKLMKNVWIVATE